MTGLCYRCGRPGTLGAHEYLVTENRILQQQITGCVRLAMASGRHLPSLGKGSGGRPWPKWPPYSSQRDGHHSLPGTAWWAAQVLSSQRGMSMVTERGVLTFAPQREAVTLEQAIVVATAGPHIPRKHQCVRMRG